MWKHVSVFFLVCAFNSNVQASKVRKSVSQISEAFGTKKSALRLAFIYCKHWREQKVNIVYPSPTLVKSGKPCVGTFSVYVIESKSRVRGQQQLSVRGRVLWLPCSIDHPHTATLGHHAWRDALLLITSTSMCHIAQLCEYRMRDSEQYWNLIYIKK